MNAATEKLNRIWQRIERAWGHVLGLFCLRNRFAAEFLDALERGEGGTVFLWWWEEDGAQAESDEEAVAALLADVDRAVHRAPAPLGVDEFFVRVGVYSPRPGGREAAEDLLEGRRLLRVERLAFDRYYDWKRGHARRRLEALLREAAPGPQAPVVAVQVLPLGGAMGALLEERWEPASPWLR